MDGTQQSHLSRYIDIRKPCLNSEPKQEVTQLEEKIISKTFLMTNLLIYQSYISVNQGKHHLLLCYNN